MKFKITVVDNYYHSTSGLYYQEFDSKEEADKYCDEKSWAGKIYFCELINIVKEK